MSGYGNPMEFIGRSPIGLGAYSRKSGISWTKIFFYVIIIFTTAYVALQIQKNKYDKKYSVALLSLLAISLVHGFIIMKIPGGDHPDPKIKYTVIGIKAFITFGILLSFLVLEILMGQNKF